MGYTKRPGTEITDFQPDNTDTIIYVEEWRNASLAELLALAQEKWPDATLSNISIAAEHIHTQCLYYDRYDGSDYTNFVVLTYTPS